MSRAAEINAYEAGLEDAAKIALARRYARRGMPEPRIAEFEYDEGDALRERFWNQQLKEGRRELTKSKRTRNKWINAIGTGIAAGALTAVSPPLGIAAAAATPVILDLLAPVDERRNFSREVVRAASGATGAAIGGLLTPGLAPVGAAFGSAIGAGFAANISDADAPMKSNFNISDKDVARRAKQNAAKKMRALKMKIRQYEHDVRTLEKRRMRIERMVAEAEEARRRGYWAAAARPRVRPQRYAENFFDQAGGFVSDVASGLDLL